MSIELDELHQQMLDGISARYQKTVGFPAYDFTRAFAMAAVSLDDDISIAESRLNIQNMTGTVLDDYIYQHRGLTRKYATYATATIKIVLGAGQVRAGDLFSTLSGVQFYAIADGSYTQGQTFVVRAYEGGSAGNVEAGAIVAMPVAIAGIAQITNEAPATGGFDAESDEDFRQRYYDDLRNPNNGSNQQAYIAWAMSVSGVGRVRVFPQAKGRNTVEVCVVGPTMEPAGSEVIQEVQGLIDPNGNGDGSGEAPIGAVCTVTTATTKGVDVAAKMVIEPETNLPAVTEAVKASLTAYFREIAFAKGTVQVSYTQVAGKINATAGVLDHENLTLNGAKSNVALGDREVPVVGAVNLT